MVVSMDRWVGKVAVVTGAGSGIGAATAKELVKIGLIVVGLDVNIVPVEELAKDLSTNKGKLHPLKCNLRQEEEIKDAFKWISEKVGPVSILINCAGVHPRTSIIDGDSDMWRCTIDVNVLGVCLATREAIASMKKNKIDGHVININSSAGHRVPPMAKNDVYPASKHAITALTETLQLEISRLNLKIKVTSISPGAVDTNIFDQELRNTTHFQQTIGKNMLKPENIVDGIVFVLSTPPNVQIPELMIKPLEQIF